MRSRGRFGRRLMTMPLFLLWGVAWGETWTGTLHDGSVIRVDPQTHKPMRHFGGGVAPLWNGVHRMEDGSVVIVREGEVVPTEGMIEAWGATGAPQKAFEHRYCDQLVRKTCGFHQECAVDQPCVVARQLLRMETDERRRAPIGAGVQPQTEASLRCQESLFDNDAFPVCGRARPNERETPCRALAEQVCGKENQCATAPACDPARQLLKMELDERLISSDPDSPTPTGLQCEAAQGRYFFAPCAH